jgi:hypothetical protein
MSKRRAHKFGTTFCSLEHGLVTITKPSVMTRQDKAMWEAILVPNVQDDELVARRGGRQDASEMCTEKSVSTCHDLELASILISHGDGPPQQQATTTGCGSGSAVSTTAATTTVLSSANRVPANVRLADLETGRACHHRGMDPPNGSDTRPSPFAYIQFGDELATSSV